MLRVLLVMAAVAMADGFSASLAVRIGDRRGFATLASRATRPTMRPATRPGLVALRSVIKVEGKGKRRHTFVRCCPNIFSVCLGVYYKGNVVTGNTWNLESEKEEECDGPATSGEIGNVDLSAAPKVKADEIKTDGIINLTPDAIAQVAKIRASRGEEEVVLRVGVRAGGCRYSTPLEKAFTCTGDRPDALWFDLRMCINTAVACRM